MPARNLGSPIWFRQLPNALSVGRLLAAPILVALACVHYGRAFTILLLAALVTDVLDGWLARRFNLHTPLGAMLDSTADVATLASAAYGIWVFHPQVFIQHALACGMMLGGWIVVCAAALLRYRRLSSFHTYASKAAGYALGFFMAALFLFGFSPELFYLAVTISVLSSAEEIALLWLLPQWCSDVRGLWWVAVSAGVNPRQRATRRQLRQI